MSIVLVIWGDAEYRNEEVTAEEAKAFRPCVTHSVGYLVSQTDEITTLAMSGWPEHPGRWSEYVKIPRLMILSTRELVEAAPEE